MDVYERRLGSNDGNARTPNTSSQTIGSAEAMGLTHSVLSDADL
jgi:hypothetical protein